MKPSDIRKELHKYLDEADEQALNYVKEAVVAYKAAQLKEDEEKEDLSRSLGSITLGELYARIEQSEENLRNGNYLTQEEVEAKFRALRAKV